MNHHGQTRVSLNPVHILNILSLQKLGRCFTTGHYGSLRQKSLWLTVEATAGHNGGHYRVTTGCRGCHRSQHLQTLSTARTRQYRGFTLEKPQHETKCWTHETAGCDTHRCSMPRAVKNPSSWLKIPAALQPFPRIVTWKTTSMT